MQLEELLSGEWYAYSDGSTSTSNLIRFQATATEILIEISYRFDVDDRQHIGFEMPRGHFDQLWNVHNAVWRKNAG